MVSTFSPNLGLEEPANGDYSGTWGSAVVNPNMTYLDATIGGFVSIDMTAGSVSLSTTQMRNACLVFSGALSANRTVTINTISTAAAGISGHLWSVQNLCTNSSLYTVTLLSTVAGSQAIAIPPSEAIDVLIEGTGSTSAGNVKFRGLGRVGSYWDHAGSSVPAWVAGCTVPPYLNCDGTTFSSAVYPALANYLGGNTLPDARGRFRAALNQGTGRITSGTSLSGVDGNTILSASGAQIVQLSSYNMPPIQITDPGHSHNYSGKDSTTDVALGIVVTSLDPTYISSNNIRVTQSVVTNITAGASVAGTNRNFAIIPPAYISGLTLIRAG